MIVLASDTLAALSSSRSRILALRADRALRGWIVVCVCFATLAQWAGGRSHVSIGTNIACDTGSLPRIRLPVTTSAQFTLWFAINVLVLATGAVHTLHLRCIGLGLAYGTLIARFFAGLSSVLACIAIGTRCCASLILVLARHAVDAVRRRSGPRCLQVFTCPAVVAARQICACWFAASCQHSQAFGGTVETRDRCAGSCSFC